MRARSLRTARRLRRLAGESVRLGARRAHGLHPRGRPHGIGPEPAVDDAAVEQRIRSEAFREVGVTASAIELEVEGGVASLRADVPDDETASELVRRVAKVPGVGDVAAMLRVVKDASKA